MSVSSDCIFCVWPSSKVTACVLVNDELDWLKEADAEDVALPVVVLVAVTLVESERMRSVAAAAAVLLHDAIKNVMATARLSRFICYPFCMDALPWYDRNHGAYRQYRGIMWLSWSEIYICQASVSVIRLTAHV
jgi:hypothetical protein